MAVKDALDISLNISRNTENSKKQPSLILNNERLKKLKKVTTEKVKKPFKKFQANESSKSLVVGVKKRIRQKSLPNIVAKNLTKVNQLKEVPKTSILKKLTSSNSKKSNILSTTETKVTDLPLKQKKVSFIENEASQSNQTLISFVKPKDIAIKTILARKRKINTEESKKSLSSIFKVSVSKESNRVDKNIVTNKTDHENKDENQETELSEKSITNNISPLENNKPKAKKFKDKLGMNQSSIKDSNETNVRSYQSGKNFSLFGNNPSIPNIGQRFVKPVHEKVFSVEKFSDLEIHPFAVSNLEQNMKITTVTTVQKKSIPVILSGSDVLIRSQTGSGKTLAYALPIIEKLQSIRPKLTRNSGIKALIIVPTRELALQTYECLLKLIRPFTWIVPGYLVGGEKRKAEKARLRKGCTILVATPGRLLDHIKHTKALKLDRVEYFILDEADRMLDMGYEKDISGIVDALENFSCNSDNTDYDALKILRQHIKPHTENVIQHEEESQNKTDDFDKRKKVFDQKQYNSNCNDDSSNDSDPKKLKPVKPENSLKEKTEQGEKSEQDTIRKKQCILLSATLTHAVEKLAGLTMCNPIFVDAAKDNLEATGGNLNEINEDLVVPESVTQSYIITPPKLRMVTLSAYIAGKCQNQKRHKILIFMATQDMVDYHAEILGSVLNKPVDEDDEDSDPLVDVEFLKLHGNMSQNDRTQVFKAFRQANSGVLLCTDVAARGLDMPMVDTVVQYTGPTCTRDYVHRIGRTARAGSSGTATIFLTPPEVDFVRMLEGRRIRIAQEDMDDVLAKLLSPLSVPNSVQEAATALQNEFENLVLENKKLYGMACKAYTSWARFYSSYPREMREVFDRRSLHLGHYAKSFALREPPQRIGKAGKSIREREEGQMPRPKHQNRLSNQSSRTEAGMSDKRIEMGGASLRQQDRRSGMLKHVRMLNVSEYDSGLEPIKKSKKS